MPLPQQPNLAMSGSNSTNAFGTLADDEKETAFHNDNGTNNSNVTRTIGADELQAMLQEVANSMPPQQRQAFLASIQASMAIFQGGTALMP